MCNHALMSKMQKSSKRRRTCRQCDELPPDGEVISRRGFCMHCAELRAQAFATAMQQKSGPAYQEWLAAMSRVGAAATRELES